MFHFKPNITVTDLCFLSPLPSLIEQKCWGPCHSLESSNINVTLCVTCSLSLLGAGLPSEPYKTHFSTHPHSSEHQPIFILHFILALINAHMFRPCKILSQTSTVSTLCTPSPSSPITSHCTVRHSIFQSSYHSFTDFRNNLLATLAKLIHWHFSIFSLKLCLLYWPLKPWQWVGHCFIEASSSLISNAFYSTPPVSVRHLPLTHSQILTLCSKEPFSFCACCTTHWTRKSWTFMWVFKCCGNVPQHSLTLGPDSVFYKASFKFIKHNSFKFIMFLPTLRLQYSSNPF